MRPPAEFDEVDRLLRWGLNDCQISRLTGIPRRTVRDWRVLGRAECRTKRVSDCPICSGTPVNESDYSYLLGIYLGDGLLSSCDKGVFKLRISMDSRYPNIIDEVGRAIAAMRPDVPMKVGHVQREGCVEIYAYWKHWPCLFPQHGAGLKHLRPIRLAGWQEQVVNRFPHKLVRGLIHSDGCRHLNRVVVRGRRYSYPRYNFTNNSDDIKRIFCEACDRLGIGWRRMNWKTIAVSRRPDVQRLDEFVGPKS